MEKQTVLLIDADVDSRLQVAEMLHALGMEVCPVRDLESAWRTIRRGRSFAAIVCASELPDGAGINFTHWLRHELVTTPVILMRDEQGALWPSNAFFTSVAKPVDAAALREALSRFWLLEGEPEMESAAA